jgi:hypothetical protein
MYHKDACGYLRTVWQLPWKSCGSWLDCLGVQVEIYKPNEESRRDDDADASLPLLHLLYT